MPSTDALADLLAARGIVSAEDEMVGALIRRLDPARARAERAAAAAASIVPHAELPPYAELLEPPKRYNVLWGGRGAARSWTVAQKLLLRGARERIRVLCVRETQSSIAESVHALLKDRIEALGLVDYVVTDKAIWHRRTRTRFMFKGLRDPDALKSAEGVDVCWVEEAQRVSERSWRLLIPTIRKEGSIFYINFNPDLESDPTYKRFVASDIAPGKPDDAVRIGEEAVVLKVGWQDNPWFPSTLLKEKDRDYRNDPEMADQVWGGNTRKVSLAQILRHKWRVEEFEPGEDWSGPYFGLDWGFAQDPLALVKCWVHLNTLYVEREAVQVELSLDQTPSFCKLHVPGCEDHVIQADNARPESIDHVKRKGLPRIVACPKWSGSVQDGILHLRSYDAIVVHPRCVTVKKECELYSYKVDALTGEVLAAIVDAHNHTIDAIRYALNRLIRRSRNRRQRVFFPGMGDGEDDDQKGAA